MTAEQLLIVFLLPPAVFGIAMALEWWGDWSRARRWARGGPSDMHRHPAFTREDCGDPACVLCQARGLR
jgi:hypothetical protein